MGRYEAIFDQSERSHLYIYISTSSRDRDRLISLYSSGLDTKITI